MKPFLFIIGLIVGQSLFAQESLIQFSGSILSAGRDSMQPIPYVLVKNKSRNSGAYSNNDGFYTLVVARGDTIEFSSIGFGKSRIIVPENIKENKFYSTHIMFRDTTMLPEAIIVPWKNVDDLKKAFVELKLDEDDIVRAYQNLQFERWKELQKSTSYDGQALQAITLNDRNRNNIQSQGVLPIQNIFNPLAWNEFIKSLQKNKKSKKTGY
jgi:signal peptidase I